MGFLKFLDRLLKASSAPKEQVVAAKLPHYEEPTGYYTVRGEGFDNAYSEWLKTRTLSCQQLESFGPEPFIANLSNRTGYVREFCLKALALQDWSVAFKPVIQRLNDYVPGNRDLALQLTLKWLTALPITTLIDALPELDAIEDQSRANHAAVRAALEQRLGTEDGRSALRDGLMHNRAMVRRACWKRCTQALAWSGQERIQAAMQCGDPAIARSVEREVYALTDDELLAWFLKLHQVRAMALRRAFLVALHRRNLVGAKALIDLALWDDSFSIRWLARQWSRDTPENLLEQYVNALNGDSAARRKRYALEGLALLKLPDGLPACKSALLDPNPALRKAALAAACSIDPEGQSLYVAGAVQDADLAVVREAFRQIIALGLPLPIDAIAAAATARREELPFFDLMLGCAGSMPIWKALHLASFTSLAAPSLQLKLAPAIGQFLNGVRVVEVYMAPTLQQWQAICAWMPMDTLAPNSGLRYVMDIYAKRMNK